METGLPLYVDIAAAMRHRDNPLECSHFALALLWHHRWVVKANVNSAPTLVATTQRLNQPPVRPWFDSYVNPGYAPGGHRLMQMQPITYDTCLAESKEALQSIPHPVANPSHYTHIERKSVIHIGEMTIKDPDQLRRGGRWRGSGAFHESYLIGIPYEFVRTVAGHGDIGSVFVVRAELEPPAALRAQVFPFVASLKRSQKQSDAQRGWPWCPENSDFISLMDHLAVVMLQDAAVMFEELQVAPVP